MIRYYAYPKCSTCRNGKKWLETNAVDFDYIDISTNPPSAGQLKEIHETSGIELKKFFNTSGKKYRELGLKDKLPEMSAAEQYELLASDGMLIKRPLAWDGTKATLGFKEEAYGNTWS
ncbi:arsenate reductase family protein [Planococcus sp. ISL-109]|uniref:arsenate reductase family protein n=1 Tax=Planococcus sp. ISL-109 TaxID=2819166 RepID=UPI001BEA2ACE|nr:arsenate reductase family protein [Planococcus sp. ISL-109]MBT2583676.1 arsenate reductase family protein [Planococcus sp. ISL-109]